MLAVNIPMAAINTAMNDFLGGLGGGSAVLLGIVLGGMMAVDMGGPVNKAAYVFGTGTLAATVSSGGSVAMAAVMAGGMVPPLAIFVATLLFKDKFTKEERNSGLTNIIMGLSFITEGAIPFGAAGPSSCDPKLHPWFSSSRRTRWSCGESNSWRHTEESSSSPLLQMPFFTLSLSCWCNCKWCGLWLPTQTTGIKGLE